MHRRLLIAVTMGALMSGVSRAGPFWSDEVMAHWRGLSLEEKVRVYLTPSMEGSPREWEDDLVSYGERLVPFVLPYLWQEHHRDHWTALRLLARLKRPEILGVCRKHLVEQDIDRYDETTVMAALEEYGGPNAGAILEAVLENLASKNDKRNLFRALRVLATTCWRPEGVVAVRRLLASPDPQVRTRVRERFLPAMEARLAGATTGVALPGATTGLTPAPTGPGP